MSKYNLKNKIQITSGVGAFVLFFFCLFSLSRTVWAQEEGVNEDAEKLLSVRIDCSIPSAYSNKAFKKTFNGIYDISGQVSISLYKGIYWGISYRVAQFRNNTFTTAQGIKIGTGYQVMGTGGRLGYQFIISENQTWSISLGYAYNTYQYSNLPYDSLYPVTKELYHSLEPCIDYYFFSEEGLAIGARVAYNFLLASFDPRSVGLNRFISYAPDDYGSQLRYLSVGLGLKYSFLRKKKAKR